MLGSARASRAGDGALAIANFPVIFPFAQSHYARGAPEISLSEVA
jgi:hypothetical protein